MSFLVPHYFLKETLSNLNSATYFARNHFTQNVLLSLLFGDSETFCTNVWKAGKKIFLWCGGMWYILALYMMPYLTCCEQEDVNGA